MYNIAHLQSYSNQILQGLFSVLNFVYGPQCAIQKKGAGVFISKHYICISNGLGLT